MGVGSVVQRSVQIKIWQSSSIRTPSTIRSPSRPSAANALGQFYESRITTLCGLLDSVKSNSKLRRQERLPVSVPTSRSWRKQSRPKVYSRHSSSSCKINLALNLLTCPTSCVKSPCAIMRACPDFTNEGCDPIVAEVSSKVAIGERVRNITKRPVSKCSTKQVHKSFDLPKHTHGGPHQALTSLRILRDKMQELEDRVHIWLKSSNLRSALIRQKNTTPGIHDTFTERDHVLYCFRINVTGEGDTGSLLKDCGNDRQIRLKVRANSLRNISESNKNGRLECVSKAAVCLNR